MKEKENMRSAEEAGEASKAFQSQAAARLQQLQQRVKASRDALFGVAQKLAEEKMTLKMKRGSLGSSKNSLRSLQESRKQWSPNMQKPCVTCMWLTFPRCSRAAHPTSQ